MENRRPFCSICPVFLLQRCRLPPFFRIISTPSSASLPLPPRRCSRLHFRAISEWSPLLLCIWQRFTHQCVCSPIAAQRSAGNDYRLSTKTGRVSARTAKTALSGAGIWGNKTSGNLPRVTENTASPSSSSPFRRVSHHGYCTVAAGHPEEQHSANEEAM